MKVSYQELNFSQKSLSQVLFLKNNHLWYFFSPSQKSRYFGGFLFNNNQALRFLDEIGFNEEIIETQILSYKDLIFYFKNNQAYFALNYDNLEIIFSLPQEIYLHFDIKHIFENQPFKRKIEFEKISSNTVLVNEFLEGYGFVKLLIEADAPLNLNQQWIEKKYDFDLKRNSPPYHWYVFNGLSGKIREIRIKILHPNLNQLNSKEIFNLTHQPLIDFLLLRINSLILDNYLPAGFPWFFENWYRDELLSLFLLKKFLKTEFLEERLKFYLYHLEEVWDKNKNKDNRDSADTFLLFILNLPQDLFLTNFKILEKYFNFWEQKFIKENELNLPDFSTWMDTLKKKTAIEILALYLSTLRRFAEINKNYVPKANYFKEKLKKEILNLDINLIFVYLFLKGILSQNEWQKNFENLIKEYYLDWGGLSTLSKNHPNFKDEDDGEKATAYHQGDSWYFLNNLTAVILHQINHKKFAKEIHQIIKSSLIDLLLDGALGFSSEVSSAKERRSENSLVQLWSMASLVYLLSFFKNINIFLESLSNSHNIISIKS